MRFALIVGSLLVIAACTPEVPDSAAGVGFDDYDTYREQRDGTLQEGDAGTLPEAGAVSPETVGDGEQSEAAGETAEARIVPENERPRAISDEQDFEAVAERETIESDAARIASNRERYVEIKPTALPSRTRSGGPSIVEYALSTTHPLGEKKYRRSPLGGQSRFLRACARYTSADLAQEDFLRAGGPERDPKGIDPDGDGYACYWDPNPFRQARNAGRSNG